MRRKYDHTTGQGFNSRTMYFNRKTPIIVLLTWTSFLFILHPKLLDLPDPRVALDLPDFAQGLRRGDAQEEHRQRKTLELSDTSTGVVSEEEKKRRKRERWRRRIKRMKEQKYKANNGHKMTADMEESAAMDDTDESSGTKNTEYGMKDAADTAKTPAIEAPWFRTTTNNTRVFLFESVPKVAQEYGLNMSPHKLGEDPLRHEFREKICSQADVTKCRIPKLRFMRCITCTHQDGTWYSGVSSTGAASGQVKENATIAFSPSTESRYAHLDVAIPLYGQRDKLLEFASRLRATTQSLSQDSILTSNLNVRLLVTAYPPDKLSLKETASLKDDIAKRAGLTSSDSVVFVYVTPSNADTKIVFNRAQAINALLAQTRHQDDSLVAIVDVDMEILDTFVENAMSFVNPNKSIYFPICWSEYNPETITAVEKFYKYRLNKYSNHKGAWRHFGYGLFAMSGTDAAKTVLDDSRRGWGGEDNDFFTNIQKHLNVVRAREPGLIHLWHPKKCNVGSFIEPEQLIACYGSLATYEGSPLGLYLRSLAMQGKGTIMIVVVSSRQQLQKRAGAIASTWAKDLPKNVIVRFFVGKGTTSIETLASQAGIEPSWVVNMEDVEDNEYPPVHKNTAVLATTKKLAESMDDSGKRVEWIFKVDDDAHVNLDALKTFLADKDANIPQLYGGRGYGRPGADREGIVEAGVKKPYCMGGPGYIVSRPAFDATVPAFKDCVDDADRSKFRSSLWHSDVVIGMCFQRETGLGCWEGDDSKYDGKRLFHQIPSKSGNTDVGTMASAISIHPVKKSMVEFHERILEVERFQSSLRETFTKDNQDTERALS